MKIYNNASEININELPDKFVLKCNHGSAMNIICKDKLKFNLAKARESLTNWKNINYGIFSKEFQYMFVERKIFVMPYLGDNIIDYEVYCFNGQPKFIRVQQLLFEHNHTSIHNYYDLNWKLTDIESGLDGYYRIPQIEFKKPKNLELMIYYSTKLSNDFVFVRIDFYELNDIVYLSELTFTPSNALMKLKDRNQCIFFGNLLNINKVNERINL